VVIAKAADQAVIAAQAVIADAQAIADPVAVPAADQAATAAWMALPKSTSTN
jgi:hypothetical protein